jgi:hypothetical protein
MTHWFRFEVDREAVTDAAFAFVVDPHPSRNERPIVQALHDVNPEMVDVLECMVLDGTDQRDDVAEYIDAVFGVRGG